MNNDQPTLLGAPLVREDPTLHYGDVVLGHEWTDKHGVTRNLRTGTVTWTVRRWPHHDRVTGEWDQAMSFLIPDPDPEQGGFFVPHEYLVLNQQQNQMAMAEAADAVLNTVGLKRKEQPHARPDRVSQKVPRASRVPRWT